MLRKVNPIVEVLRVDSLFLSTTKKCKRNECIKNSMKNKVKT